MTNPPGMDDGGDRLRRIVEALRRPDRFDHPVGEFEIVETHISIVLLTGPFAYKFKKAVAPGFLDFTTLERRRAACEAELRLNRRLNPALYVAVRTVGGSVDEPAFDREPVLEPCVQMRQFPRDAELESALAGGAVGRAGFERFAGELARFHERTPAPEASTGLGSADLVRRQCRENFDALRPLADPDAAALETRWQAGWSAFESRIESRRASGKVRECHGDLHLGNLIWMDGRIQAFDCIEFSPEISACDVMSEIAFPMMDLEDRDRTGLRRAFCNAYLEASGDYGGVPLLTLFLPYRSLVRAKVALLKSGQARNTARREEWERQARRFIRLGRRLAAPDGRPALIITRGLSGSGKTWLTHALIPGAGFIRIRSDVERKRMFAAEGGAAGSAALYGQASTERVYGGLLDAARDLLLSGWPVVIDAAFLERERRSAFRRLAEELGARFRILDVSAPLPVLRDRVARRVAAGSDASDADLAVLERQMESAEPLAAGEARFCVSADTSRNLDTGAINRALFG